MRKLLNGEVSTYDRRPSPWCPRCRRAGSRAPHGCRDSAMEPESRQPSKAVVVDRKDETRGPESVDPQRLLLEVSRLAASRRDLADLRGDLVVVLQRAVPFDRLAVVLYDRTRNEMVLHSAGRTTLPPKDIAVPLEADPSG